MRIAQVAPLYESVPPKQYGGTERVVSHLTEELVRQGHDVTLFASGDSRTRAQLVPCCPRSLRLDPDCRDQIAYQFLMLERVFANISRFDVVHFHIDYFHFPLSRRHTTPHITTLHGRLDLPELQPLYREFDDMPLVSISQAQRKPLPRANWHATIYHGLPPSLHRFRRRAGDYLLFLGRVSPEKRVDRAIEIARRSGIPLRIAAKVDKVDEEYAARCIRPLIEASPFVEDLGEVGGSAKDEVLGNALALLFPIDWPEPFGLVMIEAMACGTPVIAWRRGSVPEVIQDGVNGFIVRSLDEAVAAVRRVSDISRMDCRRTFERRFAVERMAREYVAVYQRLVRSHRPDSRAA